MYSIHPVIKRYAWGSYIRLQEMFSLDLAERSASTEMPVGEARDGGPIAEMWFSGHAQYPSIVDVTGAPESGLRPSGGSLSGVQSPTLQAWQQAGGTPVALTDLIRSDPEAMLGLRCSNEFGPVLPYLLKVISARIPLSLQVHPVDFRARAGFNEENAERKPMDAPDRSFKDVVAKNEMIVALQPFSACVGFASPTFMLSNLVLVDHPVARRMVMALKPPSHHGVFGASYPDSSANVDQEFADANSMMPMASMSWQPSRKRVFRAFHAAVTAGTVFGLHDALQQAASQVSHERSQLAFRHALAAAEAFEGDPSVLALLMMNPIELEEGESVFIPAGTPHAYIHGTGVEVMTNSDNVLRAGMTVKHKDVPNLLQNLDCNPAPPIDPSVSWIDELGALFGNRVVYRPHINEFVLSYGRVGGGHHPWPMMERIVRHYGRLMALRSRFPGECGPRIVLCLDGRVRVSDETNEMILRRGEAVFVPDCDGRIQIDSDGDPGSFIVASTQI
ncbi:mannose-6-phosphate isomerase, class I [Bifidobacterium commune]|uniref:mannose-6-phosphate isomerase n=2 Tax=Bifidobacterium commune TaxID=1505727 RepID=A0A1C4H487_9BIFI|nr:mannose-6-phosphate isomerase, class I [Bifidobacterium commune]SCC79470.1 mannose-6-phosphate isomerase, type 1 [Bifidobacterium commune]